MSSLWPPGNGHTCVGLEDPLIEGGFEGRRRPLSRAAEAQSRTGCPPRVDLRKVAPRHRVPRGARGPGCLQTCRTSLDSLWLSTEVATRRSVLGWGARHRRAGRSLFRTRTGSYWTDVTGPISPLAHGSEPHLVLRDLSDGADTTTALRGGNAPAPISGFHGFSGGGAVDGAMTMLFTLDPAQRIHIQAQPGFPFGFTRRFGCSR